jgi:putative hydrolase of the HAD superfamily
MTIGAVVFDADGVIQRPSARRRDAWRASLGPRQDVDAFLHAVFAAERPALEGRSNFVDAVAGILVDKAAIGSVGECLATWTMIESDPAVTAIVRGLQRSGIQCHLATNQELHKARFMSEGLGYAELFDREFYSCRMGVMKPALAYFQVILREIGVPGESILFVDDQPTNVDSARQAGLHATEFRLDTGPRELVRALKAFGIRFD